MRAVAALLLMGLAATPALSDEYLKSTSPKSSIDAFMRQCRQTMASDAYCRCHVRKLVQTGEGDFLVDAIATGGRMHNLQKSIGTDRAKVLLARHNITRDDALAILDEADALLRNTGQGCG